jgi:hypothetical protein
MLNPPVPVETARPPKRPTGNRRAAVRWRSAPATPGFVFLPDAYESLIGWLTDLSVSGVGLLLARPIDLGTTVHLELESPARTGSLRLEARVVRLTPQRDGDWIAGCEFARQLSEDELDALL